MPRGLQVYLKETSDSDRERVWNEYPSSARPVWGNGDRDEPWLYATYNCKGMLPSLRRSRHCRDIRSVPIVIMRLRLRRACVRKQFISKMISARSVSELPLYAVKCEETTRACPAPALKLPWVSERDGSKIRTLIVYMV